jgi:beta-glucosidase
MAACNRTTAMLLVALLALLHCAAAYTCSTTPYSLYPYCNISLPAPVRAADLVSRMTTQEKIAQMVNLAEAIPHLNIPKYNYWSEVVFIVS